MASLTDADKDALLRIARSTIAAKLTGQQAAWRPDEPSPTLLEKRGCFVTLHLNGALRGCIGTIEPASPLMEGVAENALNAAFRDPRFPPLTENEADRAQIEISALTVPAPLAFTDPEDLKNRLIPGKHGVILSKGWHRSTFLPQVWEQLPDPEVFLSHLCRKAGMGADCWRDPDIGVMVYAALYFSESESSETQPKGAESCLKR